MPEEQDRPKPINWSVINSHDGFRVVGEDGKVVAIIPFSPIGQPDRKIAMGYAYTMAASRRMLVKLCEISHQWDVGNVAALTEAMRDVDDLIDGATGP